MSGLLVPAGISSGLFAIYHREPRVARDERSTRRAMITWLRQLFRVAPFDDGSDADRLFGIMRSSEWPEVRDAWLADHPQCAACRAREDLEVHHKVPVHVDPAAELRRVNLVTLCRRCHLFVGHLGTWSSWNPDVETDAAIWRLKILRRPKLEQQHGN